MKPVKLSDLIEAVEFDSDECGYWVDLQTGDVVLVEFAVITAVEEDDEELIEDLPDWQKPQADVARAIVADSGERFVDAPDKFHFNEYQLMERFIGSIEDSAAREQLWRAIKGKGAFRNFKDTANRMGLLKRWYEYRSDAMQEFVRDWAEANQVPIDDDTPEHTK